MRDFLLVIVAAMIPIIIPGQSFCVQSNPGETMKMPELYNQSVDGFYIIAHRGVSYDYPENTMIAFQKALEMKADMIELDVLLTSDNIPVVFHDPAVDEKTDGQGLVSSFNLEELQQLDAGSWFDEQYAGTVIPTLDEVLEWASGKISINIEIKPEAVAENPEIGVEQLVLELVKKHDMQNHVLISSFSYTAVERIQKMAPDISTGLLYNKDLSDGLGALELVKKYEPDVFACNRRRLKTRWRKDLLDAGVPIFVYTVNRERRMRRLIRQGISGIFTDRPDLLRKVAIEELAQQDN